jgi:small subunit ribosomal protein S20
MPVTKTAKRALRVSERNKRVNDRIRANLEIAIRMAKKQRSQKAVREAISLVDRAAKKSVIHKNKAARIKSSLDKLINTRGTKLKKTSKGKTSKSKASKKK